MGIPYSAEHAQDLAIAISQIVPILLLAAVAVPLRLATPKAHGHPGWGGRTLFDLVLTCGVVAACLATEYAALFGVVAGGLSRHDVHLLERAFFVTAVLCGIRILAPVVEKFADVAGVKERHVWSTVLMLIAVAFAGFLFVMDRSV